jgi:RNA polymerase sigma-70 factor (ECF subfamily)
MDDLEFVQRCVKGDTQAWNDFIAKYSHLIYNYIYSALKIKGAKDPEQDNVNDLFQEIFLLLRNDNFQKLKTFKAKNGCSLASWLRQVVVNFTVDYLRRAKAAVSLDEEGEDGFSLKETLAADIPHPVEGLIREEQLLPLEDCIAELDTQDKFFLEMHFHREINLDGLKDLFGVSRPALDMRKSRLIDRLKDCFRRKGFALDF